MSMTIREYARHRGVSHTAVRKALQSGRIQHDEDGKIDPVRADASWADNTRTSVETTWKPDLEMETSQGDASPDYATSRALRESYEAKLKKLEYEKASSLLISREDVTSKVFALARGTRDRLLQIPRRMAAQLAAVSDQHEVEALLLQSLREALADLENLHDSDNSSQQDSP